MTTPFATETATLKQSSSGKYRVRLLSEGQGSSGYYPAETLKEYGAETFPIGTKLYVGHATKQEHDAGGGRSIRDIGGKTTTEPKFDSRDNGLYAEVKFGSNVLPIVEDYRDDIALSIEVYRGKKDDEGNIVEMHAHPLNSVAIVPVGGRDGKILDLIESFRSDNGSEDEREIMEITDKDRLAIAEDAAKQVIAALDAREAAAAAAVVPVVADEPDVLEVAEAIAASGLPKVQLELVGAAIKAGTPYAEAIKAQVTLRDEIQKALTESASNVASGKSSEGSDDGGKEVNYSEQYDARMKGGK